REGGREGRGRAAGAGGGGGARRGGGERGRAVGGPEPIAGVVLYLGGVADHEPITVDGCCRDGDGPLAPAGSVQEMPADTTRQEGGEKRQRRPPRPTTGSHRKRCTPSRGRLRSTACAERRTCAFRGPTAPRWARWHRSDRRPRTASPPGSQ